MSFKLRGVAYPLQVDTETGNLKVATDTDLIGSHIISMLETEPLENPMRPTYGIPGQLFNSNQSWQAYAAEVEARLVREVPQANIKVIGSLGEDGAAFLNVYWAVNEIQQEPITVQVT